MQSLQSGSVLQNGKYKILSTLGQGGFGITYLAENTMLEGKVAIKEFFFKDYCNRDEATSHVTIPTEGNRELVERFKQKFIKEARTIFRLNHPNIIRILDIFEENATAYYVMEYCEGGTLDDKIRGMGYLPEPLATRYILQVAEALDYIHQHKVNHLDVKPANIMLNELDATVLIDFGLSKQYDAAGGQTSTTPVGISEGYAPLEQYMQGGVGEFSPQTDIYALGATFFKLLTGTTPPGASAINEYGVPIDTLKSKGVSQAAIQVICKAMESRKRDRMKTVCEFIDGLKNAAHIAQNKKCDEVNSQHPEHKNREEKAIIGVVKQAMPNEQTCCINQATTEPLPPQNPDNNDNPKHLLNWIQYWIIVVVAAILMYITTSRGNLILEYMFLYLYLGLFFPYKYIHSNKNQLTKSVYYCSISSLVISGIFILYDCLFVLNPDSSPIFLGLSLVMLITMSGMSMIIAGIYKNYHKAWLSFLLLVLMPIIEIALWIFSLNLLFR